MVEGIASKDQLDLISIIVPLEVVANSNTAKFCLSVEITKKQQRSIFSPLELDTPTCDLYPQCHHNTDIILLNVY